MGAANIRAPRAVAADNRPDAVAEDNRPDAVAEDNRPGAEGGNRRQAAVEVDTRLGAGVVDRSCAPSAMCDSSRVNSAWATVGYLDNRQRTRWLGILHPD